MDIIRWLRGMALWSSPQPTGTDDLADINAQLAFRESKPLTLGVEFELALLDANTLKPANQAISIIDKLQSPDIKKELFEHMVEVTTGVCNNVQEARTQLQDNLLRVQNEAMARDLLLCGSGRPPSLMVGECNRVEDERYAYLSEQRKIINERFGTLGMHVHLGMPDAASCVRYHNFFMHFLPHLIALSAASPFEEGNETGLASARTIITESLPVGGLPYFYRTWQEYVDLCHAMVRAGSIRHLKDLWWDLRASPGFGTLEIRVCDQPSNLKEGMAIVALIHLLGIWFSKHQDWLEEMPRPDPWRLRENKWRAIRYGIEARIITNGRGDTRSVMEDVNQWLERLEPYITEMGYQGFVADLRDMMVRGNSARRQQRLYAATQSADAVTRLMCDELKAMMPLYEPVEEAEKEAAAKTEAAQPLGLPPQMMAG